jgi:hypothetical protein
MNGAMRTIVEEMRWVIAILGCLVIPVFGMLAGFALTGVAVIGLLGSDVDGWMNLFLCGPVGALAGLVAGALVGSRAVRWARDSEARC